MTVAKQINLYSFILLRPGFFLSECLVCMLDVHGSCVFRPQQLLNPAVMTLALEETVERPSQVSML